MKTCVICGKEFTPRNCVQKTCSKACSRENGRRRCREYKHLLSAQHKVSAQHKGSIAARRLNGEILCMWCGNEFATKNPLKKFCCDDHAQKFFAQLLGH